MEKQTSFHALLTSDMTLAYKQEGTSFDLTYKTSYDISSSRNPASSHLTGSMEMDITDASPVQIEFYTLEESGSVFTYTKTGEDSWVKTNTEKTENDTISSELSNLVMNELDYVLDNKKQLIGGEKHYILTAEVTGDKLASLLASLSSIISSQAAKEELSDISALVTLKLNCKTGLPGEMLIDLGDSLSGIVLDEETDASLQAFSTTVQYLSFGECDQISIPEEIIRSAINYDTEETLKVEETTQAAESDTTDDPEADTDNAQVDSLVKDASGAYALKDADGNIIVTLEGPEGFTLSPYADDSSLSFAKSDASGEEVTAVYHIYEIPHEDYLFGIGDSMGRYTKEDGYTELVVEEPVVVPQASMEITYLKCSYIYEDEGYYTEYYCTIPLGAEKTLILEVTDYAYNKNAELITEGALIDTFFRGVTIQ